MRQFRKELESYQDDLSRVQILSHQESIDLHKSAKRASRAIAAKKVPKSKDADAHRRLVESVLRIAFKEALKYRNNAFELPDLVQQANLQCVRAVDAWDPKKGKLSTIATTFIRNGLTEFVVRHINLPFRIPESTVEVARNLGDRKVCASDLVEDRTASHYDRAFDILSARSAMRITNFENLKRDDEDESYEPSILQDVEDDELKYYLKRIRQALCMLKDRRTKDMIKRRYGFGRNYEPHTLQEIADIYKITKERIRQIITPALEKIRDSIFHFCKGCGGLYNKKKFGPTYCGKCKHHRIIPCKICKKKFMPRNKRTECCSMKCRNKAVAEANKKRATIQPIECPTCHHPFLPSEKRGKYCSQSCASTARRRKPKKCEYCDNDFIPTDSKQRFCCRQCGADFRSSKPKVVLAPVRTEIIASEESQLLSVG